MKLAVLGDFLIDEFIYYQSLRLSPESPCPVVNFQKSRKVAGGAANVANSCFSLGIEVYFLFCSPKNLINKDLLFDYEIFTYTRNDFDLSIKKRHCVDNRQFFREDKETPSINFNDCFENIDKCIEYMKNNKITDLLISDYQKGALTPKELQYLLLESKKSKIRTFVDTKISSSENLKNIYLLKPNLKEFNQLTGIRNTSSNRSLLIDELELPARKLMRENSIENCIITLSEMGSVWFGENETISFKSPKVSVIDIVGAGDSFISALVFTYLNNETYTKYQKLKIANNFAEITIKKEGTNPICKSSLDEVLNKVDIAEIGFTNGCFDILHPGHISLLKQAKKRCKFLIVGLNSDESVKRLKGKKRPINSELDRKKVLENIKFVDQVIIFNEDDPLNLIKKIKPDLLVKGADYDIKNVVGAEFTIKNGGNVFLANLLNTKSTTERVQNINNED
ncbi:ADP-heptose synthase [Prochlorococcus marinus str. MIT 9321]|uniref:ADP-heptose synthase n=1 Tax=Prochlorococcus marinus str. MIT 9401 TaxID=167551 RepID=A0A0A2BBJ1_PROMR|nr:PfkB family carbohydrate kinase [Prochlorococcus marinus]KGG02855.1 ADP-heptose synthase [Prochlorococcus marinus str. MIT 9321]KGG05478.1 ADP-heptose synthase [Prochlorococcus marinus str. MIT 9322]KGG10512.1 ADP-heptose synthase [Prochlorococcus marinus str. MIT 9401]